MCTSFIFYTEAGPPPTKRSRLEKSESAQYSNDGHNTSTAGPSLASGLDNKLSEWNLYVVNIRC